MNGDFRQMKHTAHRIAAALKMHLHDLSIGIHDFVSDTQEQSGRDISLLQLDHGLMEYGLSLQQIYDRLIGRPL
jgi:hypothetical protein